MLKEIVILTLVVTVLLGVFELFIGHNTFTILDLIFVLIGYLLAERLE